MFLCMADQRIGYVRDFFKQSIYIDFVCKNEWIETPYHRSTAESINEPAESIYPLHQRWNVWFKPSCLVIINCILNIAPDSSLFEYRQVRQQRFRILRPKNNETGIREWNIDILPRERITPPDVTFFETMEKPIRIKRRNVSGPAIRGVCAKSSVLLSLHMDMVWCFIILKLWRLFNGLAWFVRIWQANFGIKSDKMHYGYLGFLKNIEI